MRIQLTVVPALIGFLLFSCSANTLDPAVGDMAVSIYRGDGELGGGFVPRANPYEPEEGPSVTLWLPPDSKARTAAGQLISGVKFIGWRESSRILVQSYLLVPKAGAADYRVIDDEELRPVLLASHRLSNRSQVAITELAQFGVNPMALSLTPNLPQ